MDQTLKNLFNDEYTGAPPAKRALGYIQYKREQGNHVAGIYCGYAPTELIQAMEIVPAMLCAFNNSTISAAEEILPSNLCPLIKSSYGFIRTDTCPFYGISEAVIAETTCDGKKKMFELIADIKPTHVMDLPQLPDENEAKINWTAMLKKLQAFLENTFQKKVSDTDIENAIKDTNEKNRLMRKIFEYAAMEPSVISWNEMYDVVFLAMPSTGKDIKPKLYEILEKLDNRVKNAYAHGKPDAPRVMVTGCPVGGDATKIFKIIEGAGAVVVALDSCTGMKSFMDDTEESTSDPVRALAEKYLRLPCSCMTPNNRRLTAIDKMIEKFKPQVVVDLILHACHSYNIESYKIGEHIKKRHNIPFLKIVTDYSDGDVGQIQTRVEAVLESIR